MGLPYKRITGKVLSVEAYHVPDEPTLWVILVERHYLRLTAGHCIHPPSIGETCHALARGGNLIQCQVGGRYYVDPA